MANVAQLIRRQSSRELLRVPLDRLELRELQHRLLPGPGETGPTSATYGAAVNAGFVDDPATASSAATSSLQLGSQVCRIVDQEIALGKIFNHEVGLLGYRDRKSHRSIYISISRSSSSADIPG